MSQVKQISQTLKKILRQQHVTYKQIADQLDMSEANIKRIFSTDNFSLERLEKICQLVNLTLSDFFQLLDKQQERITQLTSEQEKELVSDTKLFLVAVCVRDAWRFDDIISYYQISEHECIRLLARLDKLRIIQLLPANEYKLVIAQNFRWIPNGPLEQYMANEVIAQFMTSRFNEKNSFRFYLRGTYSQSFIDMITRKLNQLTNDAALLNQEDAKLPLKNRQHMGLLVAMRPWELSRFEALRKN